MSEARYGIIGWPIAHSLSPVMQQAAFDALNIPARYETWEVPPEDLAIHVQQLRAWNVQGFNVTVPHKVSILPYLQSLDISAKMIGAVNTVVSSDQGWVGYNTDAIGFLDCLAEFKSDLAQFEEIGKANTRSQTWVIIGTGGAARAIAAAGMMSSSDAAPKTIHVLGRDRNKTQELVTALKTNWATFKQLSPKSDHIDIQPHPLNTETLRKVLASCHLLIQTTSATMGVHVDPDPISNQVPWEAMPSSAVCMDIVYKPLNTTFLHTAERHGFKTINGLGMLMHQGAHAFEHWTRQRAPRQIMRSALMQAIASE